VSPLVDLELDKTENPSCGLIEGIGGDGGVGRTVSQWISHPRTGASAVFTP
jgi:hypothetical protein